MAKKPQQSPTPQAQEAGADTPKARPYIVRLEWRTDPIFGTRDLWAVLSDGTTEKVQDAG